MEVNELHILVHGIKQHPLLECSSDGRRQLYCVVSCWPRRHRSRLTEHTAAPHWNEEFVFDCSGGFTEDHIRIEVYRQGWVRDELLFKSLMELPDWTNMERQKQQQRLQLQTKYVPGSNSGSSTNMVLMGSPTPAAYHHSDPLPQQQQQQLLLMHQAAGSGTGWRDPAVKTCGLPLHSASPHMPQMKPTPSCLLLPLSYPAESSSSSSSAFCTAATADGSRSAKAMVPVHVSRDVQASSTPELLVSVWRQMQPTAVQEGIHPRVVSFVQPPGRPHSLPSVTHTELYSKYEEPCVAFVRLVVSDISLGPAAAAAAATAAARFASPTTTVTAEAPVAAVLPVSSAMPAAAAAAVCGGAGRHLPLGSGEVLRRILGLLEGRADAELDVAASAAVAVAALSADERATHIQQQKQQKQQRGSAGLSHSSSGRTSAELALIDWSWKATDPVQWLHSLEGSEGSASTEDRLHNTTLPHGSNGENGSNGGHRHRHHHRHHQQQQQQPGTHDSSTHSNRDQDTQLHVTVSIQLGDQHPQTLRTVPVNPGGSAPVRQAAVFAVRRPLADAAVMYRLRLHQGAMGHAVLELMYRYSLLELLRCSPGHPVLRADWRAVARAAVSGVQVPLPKLPKSHLDLSAFLADADARASVYQLPPVSSHSYNTRQQQQVLAVTTTSPAAAAGSAVQLKSQVVTRQQPAHHIAPAGASMPGSPVGIRLQPAVIAGPVKPTAVPAAAAAAAAAVVRPLAVKAAAGTDAVGQVRGGRGDMQHHHNAATAGKPAVNGPLAVLQMTLQGVNLRQGCGEAAVRSGLSLLIRSGPHWLDLKPAALPLTISSSSSGGGGGGISGGVVSVAHQAPAVKVLLPVYDASCLVALVLHNGERTVGRRMLRLHGLLPLLLRQYSKSLLLFSPDRDASGARTIIGSVQLQLSAAPTPGSSIAQTIMQLALAFVFTPHTLNLHSSAVATMGRAERGAAVGGVVRAWMAEQGQSGVAEPLMQQLVPTGGSDLSIRTTAANVLRIKSVLLCCLPTREALLDLYAWRHPPHNLLVLWLLSALLLATGPFLLVGGVLAAVGLIWHNCKQWHSGVLGFETQPLLPPEVGAGLVDAQVSKRHRKEPEAPDRPHGTEVGAKLAHQLQSGHIKLSEKQQHAVDFGKRAAHKAKDKVQSSPGLRRRLGKVVSCFTGASVDSVESSVETAISSSRTPDSLVAVWQQLESGEVGLEALTESDSDAEAVARHAKFTRGLLLLARKYKQLIFEYAISGQGLLDAAAGIIEGLYAVVTAQDLLGSLLLCVGLLGAGAFCCWAGVGAGLSLLVIIALRPPALRHVPGVVGIRALAAHLRNHGRTVEELTW